jgi:hypothetical protein
MPVMRMVTGMKKAATTPPAENSDHQMGSLDLAMELTC